MEKEINLDQEDVLVTVVEEVAEEINKIDYSGISEEEFTTIDESEIDWSIL